ncbi:MAG TPA: thioredoxin domain-containing protein [Candidatus Binatia bacterium]|nr:thioredoxin domain-containing protein [Candidatus Binatia bacterium]
MKRVNGMMVEVLSLIVVSLVSTSALAQPIKKDEIFALLTKDGPTRGSDNAPVTLIEFSDFRCSFCRKFWQMTLPLLDEKYISTGKVRFIYRHFAVLGKPSELAAQAAECAGEQAKFWEYHDRLFAGAGSPFFVLTDGKLKDYAKELGLKDQAFNQCLDSGKHLKKVEGETSIAAFLGARGTPAFFLNRRLIVGAQPFEVFESLIEVSLKNSSLLGKAKP